MSTIRQAADGAAIPPPAGDTAEAHRLRGNLGVFQLLFTVLAFNGPLAVVVGFAPVVIGYGNGLGAPMAYVAAAALVALFAVGFVKMARRIQNPGGFYSFITAGLGRQVGLGASFLAVACYYLLLVGSYAFSGIALQALVSGTLNGPDIAWWVYAVAAQAFVAVLGYFNLDVSAKVLLWLLAAEVLIIVVYDAFVVAQGGADGLHAASILPSNMFSGSVGLALLFGMLCMGGFEVSVIFRDEVRDPDRTIPRATFGFIAVVGVLYGVTTWAIIQALGESEAIAASAADPTGSFLATMQTYVGTVGVDLVNVLLNTSILACLIASHNVLARYIFNLGVDGILPESVARVHNQHGSPARSSIVTSAVVFLGLVPFVIMKSDPATLYAQLVGGFGYALIILLLLTDVAVAVFLLRTKPDDVTIWHSTIAPALAFAGLVATLFLATKNISVLITAGQGFVVTFLVALYGAVALGVVVAMILKGTKPEVYARIGRQ